MNIPIKRRRFLGGVALGAIAIPTILPAARDVAANAVLQGDEFEFEVTRSEAEWRAMLSDFEYGILRDGKTEPQKTSPLWNETRTGAYHCRGCDLHVYQSGWQVVVETKGWVFFRQNVPNAVLMGIDGKLPSGMAAPEGSIHAAIEVHCRRCGSHFGHILLVGATVLHCTNGTSYNFKLSTG